MWLQKSPSVLLRSYVIVAMFKFLQLISWISFYELSHLKDATLASMFVCCYEPGEGNVVRSGVRPRAPDPPSPSVHILVAPSI